MVRAGDEIHNPRNGQTARFAVTRHESNGDMMKVESVNPPSDEREPLHFHPRQENVFDVKSGRLWFEVNSEQRTLGPGETLKIAPGVSYRFWVEGDEDAVYSATFRPALRIEDFFDTYFALARDGKLNKKGMPNPLMLAVMGDAFWDEMRVTNPPPWVQRIVYTLLAPVGRLFGYCVRGNDSTD